MLKKIASKAAGVLGGGGRGGVTRRAANMRRNQDKINSPYYKGAQKQYGQTQSQPKKRKALGGEGGRN